MKMQSDGQRLVRPTPPDYPYAEISPQQSWLWRWCVHVRWDHMLVSTNYFVTKKGARRWATRQLEQDRTYRSRKAKESEIIQ